MKVVIAGGGIGGLVTALSLHQVGIEVCVHEQVSELKPLGVGINLLPSAVRELTELGLADMLDRLGVPTSSLTYYNKFGQQIWTEPRGRDAGYNWPQYSIHRGAFQMAIAEEVEKRIGVENISYGSQLFDFQDRDESVRAIFSDRNSGNARVEVVGDILIGADGIHSAMRRKLVPDEGAPIWNGAILWRGVTEGAPFLDGRSMIMAGHEQQKFVCYPISRAAMEEGKAVNNWIAELRFRSDYEWRREDWNRLGDPMDFLPAFEHWIFDWLNVPEMIRGAEASYEYPMVDRDPLRRWSHGRVTMLGDAAHPMYPIGSNGATQAILDARVLTKAFLDHGIGPEALKAYEDVRRLATKKIVLTNRQNGPEQVMQMAEDRAPGGYEHVNDVISRDELESVAAQYKQIAGFDKNALNARDPIVPVSAYQN